MAKMTVKAFLDYVKEAKSKNTFKEYKRGVEAFVDWFGRSGDEILALRHEDVMSGDPVRKKRFLRELEKFHKNLLDQGYTINSARTMCLGIQRLFSYYEMGITLPSGSEVSKTVTSTKDFVLSPQHIRGMFSVADLRGRVMVSMAKDLGWRVGDFITIQKNGLPDLEQEAPIPFDLITEKEDVLAKSYLSQETVDLLKTYIPTLPEENPYLFPSNRSKHLDGESVTKELRRLAKKAQIRIPENKRLRFHCFRKLFLSTCANLKIDVNIAKILVGKDVEEDMLTYLSSVDLKKAFIEVQGELCITTPTKEVEMKSKELETLRKELEHQKRMMKMMMEVYGEEIAKKAIERLTKEGVSKPIVEKVSDDLIKKRKSSYEVLEEAAKIWEEQEEAESKAEYERLIEEPNNNH